MIVQVSDNMPTYKEIVEKFKAVGCVLHTNEDECNKMSDPFKSIFRFKSVCGHDNTVTLTNFWYKGTGAQKCKDCMKQDVSETLVESKNDCNLIEHNGFLIIKSCIEEEFDIRKTKEGCLADIIIKPKYVEEDAWLMIQLKTTKDICHNLYSFSIHKNDYKDCVIVCICIKDNKIWVLDNDHVKGKIKLNIGLSDVSSYFKYQVDKTKLCDVLTNKYIDVDKMYLEYCMIPRNICQQQEQEYRTLREQHISFLDYKYPEIDGRVYDFTINNYKIQEKVASLSKKNARNPVHVVTLGRSTGSFVDSHRAYKEGDNDFYWIWKKGHTKTFYIFPEDELLKRGYIQENNNNIEKRKSFALCSWTDEFKYSVDDINLQNKLQSIFGF